MKKKLINILLLCFLIVSCGNPRPHGGDEIPPLSRNNYLMGFLNENRASYDVSYYDINIDFDIENKSLDGFVTIKAKSLSDIDILQVDLTKDLDIKKITYENNELEYSREEDAVLVVFPNTILNNTLFDFTVHYEGVPQGAVNPPWAGGFTWSKDKNGRDWVAVSCEGEGARIWWPNKDHITEEPDSVKMSFTVPSDLMCVANGQLRNTIVEAPYLGMEHQSAITYGNGFSIYNGVRSGSWGMYGVIDPLIIHETGHEWFGNSVTASDPTHIWIHEGLQVYSEAIYFEDKFDSYPVSVDYLKGIKGRIANKIPIVGNEDENHWALSSDTYMKGAWIMHTLRSVINNDIIWFEILKEFMINGIM